MARRKIREYDGKKILCQHLLEVGAGKINLHFQSILVTPETDIDILHLPEEQKYVVKPDMLFGKRKQYGLVLMDASSEEVKQWIKKFRNKSFTVGKATGILTHFLIEPFIVHQKEYYFSLTSVREGDLLQFSFSGGAGIEERWETVNSVIIPTGENAMKEYLGKVIPDSVNVQHMSLFVNAVLSVFRQLHFCSLEINPFTIDAAGEISLLDLVAEVDDCASFKNLWPEVRFPHSFGRNVSSEEEYIQQLDQDSGASLKLTLLSERGKVWNIFSGGGASIISLDSLSNAGLSEEIANYGEYSGNPTPEESYQYAKTILQLMTKENENLMGNLREKTRENKVILIAGAIANFTDVEKTFSGIIRALEEYQDKLKESKTKIIVRRGGPNYEKGLQLMKGCGEKLGLSMEIYGPEMSLAGIAEKVKEVIRN